MKNVRTTNVMRNSATSPATMNASRYSRITVRADGGRVVSPAAVTGSGLMLMATRTIAKSAISASSSSGVTERPRYFAVFRSLMRAALPILSLK